MEISNDEYINNWETNMFLQFEEFHPSCFEYESSSPEGTQVSSASKNIVSERKRRKKLNERLYALRSVVPNITKMDKASTVRDAIEYIKLLQHEERIIQSQISELESIISMSSLLPNNNNNNNNNNIENDDQEDETYLCMPKKRARMEFTHESTPIEVLELSISSMGEKNVMVSLTCSKRRDTIVKLCEAFESLNLKIITSTINHFSGRLFKTVFFQSDEEEKDVLRVKIEAAIAALNNPHSPISS
ncbi:hypothetical protein ACP275_12G163000 [Erythranthe tilingii]